MAIADPVERAPAIGSQAGTARSSNTGAAGAPGTRIVFGYDEQALRRGENTPVLWQESDAVNAHIGLFGKSGSGKTHTIRRIVSQVVRAHTPQRPVRVHVMDVHGDLVMPGESTVMFSEATPYGINPLRLATDPHHGGVRKRIQSFIEQLDEVGRSPMGERQTSSLRNLLIDLYASRGFKMDDPTTWAEQEGKPPVAAAAGRNYLDIPFEAKDAAKEAAAQAGVRLSFDGDVKCWYADRYEGTALEGYPRKTWGKVYPTLADAAAFAKTRLRSMTVGGSTRSTRLLEDHAKRVVAWQAKARKMEAGMARHEDVQELQSEVMAGVDPLVDSFRDYVEAIATGRELDALLRFDTLDTLRSLTNRLEGMVATGIFRSGTPPFDPAAPVWRHNLTALSLPEQKLYVYTVLTRIFEEARERGITPGAAEIRDLIVVDEASRFFADRDTNILDVISREARKFGVGLVCASQSPTDFSEAFLANTGTKALLGLDAMYHDQTRKKMRVGDDVLNGIEPGRVAAIQCAKRGESNSPFRLTRVAA